MKTLKNICKKEAEKLKEKPRLCEYVSTPNGIVQLTPPDYSNQKSCDWCGGSENYTPPVEPSKSQARTWLCANPRCEVLNPLNQLKPTLSSSFQRRAILWPLFCEINGIGDLNHDVKFENLDQDHKKVAYMLKFAASPKSIIFMSGDKGTGKTYASMAICEYFTRTSTSCIFTTQKKMTEDWLENFQRFANYVERVKNISLLVIDDFGTGQLPPGFLAFFMDLINTRMQWSDRGTIISTNLNNKDFVNYCGGPLSDRIMTGMCFIYDGNSRRKRNIL